MGHPACDPSQPSGRAVRARVLTGTPAAFRNCDCRRGERHGVVWGAQNDARGLTFAGGLRGFTGGDKHRAFLEGSVSQLFVESGPLGSSRRLYGPGVQAGYQFVAPGGFTIMASLGLGYAPGVSRRVDGWAGLLGLAAGYTWRRMSQRDLRPMR
jgi:hypothetical protein